MYAMTLAEFVASHNISYIHQEVLKSDSKVTDLTKLPENEWEVKLDAILKSPA